MKERPILFSDPMVKAILEGRKTQTRRIVTPGNSVSFGAIGSKCVVDFERSTNENVSYLKVPFRHKKDEWESDPCGDTRGRIGCRWEVGDHLWVRETLQLIEVDDYPQQFAWGYAADQEPIPQTLVNTTTLPYVEPYQKCPSIFMPRWASRILLEIVSVRVERLQDISEGDAQAEGIHYPYEWEEPNRDQNGEFLGGSQFCYSYIPPYQELWEPINGPGSWEANPWVWVVEFKVVKP